MDKRPAWKEKAWAAKCHEGYADVTYEDVWSLDIRLARLIANHLRAFLKAEKGPHGGAPGRLARELGTDKAYDRWLNILRKMIYAFEEYQRKDNSATDEADPEKERERKERIRAGMQLFVDYFENLWS